MNDVPPSREALIAEAESLRNQIRALERRAADLEGMSGPDPRIGQGPAAQADNALSHLSEDQPAAVLDSVPCIVIIVDAKTRRFTFVNRYGRDYFAVGHHAHDLDGRYLEVMARRLDGTPYDLADVPAERSIRLGESVRDEEMIIRKPDGTEATILANSTPIRNHDGSIAGAVTTFIDITRHKQAEASARESAEALRNNDILFKTVYDSTSALVFIKDRDSRVVFINDVFEQSFGIDGASVIGKNDLEIYDDHDLASHSIAHDQEVMRTGQAQTFEESANSPTGIRHFQLCKSPWRNARGEIIGVVGTGMDITELKRLEHELRQNVDELAKSDRNKTHFLNVLSHELRNPLAAMVGSIDLLAGLCNGEKRADRAIGIFRRQSRVLQGLVDDLLDVSRISANKIQLRKETVDLAELLRRVAGAHLPQFEEKGVILIDVLPAAPVMLEADPMRLTQVFGNLLGNALKFTPAGGQVQLTATVDGERNEALVSVIDTGIGIDPDTIPRIFEPFSQAEQSLAMNHGGLGLGLSIVRSLVRLHGGLVEAHSDGLDKGTCFTVRLPVHST